MDGGSSFITEDAPTTRSNTNQHYLKPLKGKQLKISITTIYVLVGKGKVGNYHQLRYIENNNILSAVEHLK